MKATGEQILYEEQASYKVYSTTFNFKTPEQNSLAVVASEVGIFHKEKINNNVNNHQLQPVSMIYQHLSFKQS